MNLDPSLLAYSAIIVVVAYTVRGIAGFGSALIAVPMLALRFPLVLVVPLIVALDYMGSASQGLRNRQQIAWRELLPLLPSTLVGVGVALVAFNNVDAAFMRKVLGVFVIVFAIYQVLPVPQLRVPRLGALPFGMFGGLFGTLFGTGGPVYVTYLGFRGLDKTALRASFATYFVLDATLRLAGYAATGLFDASALLMLAGAVPLAAAGLYLGGRVQLGLSATAYKRMISVVLLGSGIALLLKA